MKVSGTVVPGSVEAIALGRVTRYDEDASPEAVAAFRQRLLGRDGSNGSEESQR